MLQTLLIAVGGAAGALLRYWTSNLTHLILGRDFPWGTLTVNVTGSLMMGLLYVFLLERMNVGPEVRAALIIGLLGAFTTFSAFSIETLNLFEAGEVLKAGANVVLGVTLGIAGCWFGLLLGRQL